MQQNPQQLIKPIGKKPFLLIFAAVFCLAGLVVLARSSADLSLLEHSLTTPQQITAASLAIHGPGSNYYVHITDYKLINPQMASRSEDAKHTVPYLVCDMVPNQPPSQKHNAIKVSNYQVYSMHSVDFEQFLHSHSMNAFAYPPSNNEVSVYVKSRPDKETQMIIWKCGAFPVALAIGCLIFAFRK